MRSEFTVLREGPDRFYLVGAARGERHDFDYPAQAPPARRLRRLAEGDDPVRRAGGRRAARSREVLQKLTDADLSNEAFPWLSGKLIVVGAAPARALRVNFVGELGWELHHPIEMQNYIFDLLMEAGRELGIKPFGIRAMDALRLEKSYRLIPRELSIEYCALESGLDRFVHPNKGQFIGRDALVEWRSGVSPTDSSRWKCRTPWTRTPVVPSRFSRTAMWLAGARRADLAGASENRWRSEW